MTRTRSEYRVAPIPNTPAATPIATRHPTDSDRDELAGYRSGLDRDNDGVACEWAPTTRIGVNVEWVRSSPSRCC